MIAEARRRLWLRFCPHDRWAEVQDAPAVLVSTDRAGEETTLVLPNTFYRCLGCGKETEDAPASVFCAIPGDGIDRLGRA